MFQRKFLKLQCEKTTSKRQEKIILLSDSLSFFRAAFLDFVLRFLINAFERLSFQNFLKTGSCDSPKYEVPDISILEEFKFKFVFVQTYICYAKTDNASFFISIRQI